MKRVALVSPKRTAIGNFNGGLSSLSAPELGAVVIKSVLEDANLKPELIDEVLMGNVLQAGIGQNPARQAMIKAGVPIDTPASTINTVCGSGLHSVGLAFNLIQAGQCDVVMAGGMESMSSSPYLLKAARNGYRLGNGEIFDSLVSDGLTCPFNQYHMGITAENLAEKYEITRAEQDEFSVSSQMKASRALADKVFEAEIAPVVIKTKKEEIIFAVDEYVKTDCTLEKITKLRPAFKPDGTVTAANASGINDGAAAVLVVSEEKCKELDLKPMAYIKGYSLVGVEPKYMGIGPSKAVTTLLKKMNLNLSDIGLFELNEAFAAQALSVAKELGLNPEIVNVNGGAIALGHPVGASGTRILVSLVHEMTRRNIRYGIAGLCIGSGMGIAMLIENAN